MNMHRFSKHMCASALAGLVFAVSLPARGTEPSQSPSAARTLVLPASLVQPGDAIMELYVTVNCGYISELQRIPELWDINMGFDIPSVQQFHATVRLGAAAADGLGSWAHSIRIVSEESDCFSVKIKAIGREHEYHWSGAQIRWEP